VGLVVAVPIASWYLLSGHPLRSSEPNPSSGAVAAPTIPTATVASVPANVPPVPSVAASAFHALPEATYGAAISGLIGYNEISAPPVVRTTFLTSAVPVFGSARAEPVAQLPAKNFLGNPTVIDEVGWSGPWVLVLTPARSLLPSQAGGHAPATTAGWVPATDLPTAKPVETRVTVDLATRTATISGLGRSQSLPVAIGAADTPTPVGVGYIQARYVDPAQGTGIYPINLTTLHSTVGNEPLAGSVGGLIALHYFPVHTGAVSHGCVRASVSSDEAFSALPLGTVVTVVND
jgi:hypothetical protein